MTALDLYLLNAYLDGALDEAAAEAFELLLMERPDLAELVDADSALRFGLTAADQGQSAAPVPARAQVGAAAAATGPAPAPQTNVVPMRLRPRWSALAIAASVMLAVGLGTGMLLRAPSATVGAAQLVYVDKTRSISAIPQVSVSASEPLVLLVPVASVDACVADIEIRQGDATTLKAQASPDEFGYASLVLPSAALHAGRAQISVRCGASPAAEYPLDVVVGVPKP